MSESEAANSLGWGRVAALTLTHFFQHIIASSLAPILRLIQSEFALSYSQLGLLVSLPSLSGGLLQFPAGILADRGGKMRVLLTGFALLVSLVFFSGLAPTFAVLLVIQLLRGVAESTFHPTTYALISQSVPRHRLGRSMSIHTLGGVGGSAAGLIIVAKLAESLGWRSAFMIIALPGAALWIFLKLWFKEPAASTDTEPAILKPRGSPRSGPFVLIFFIAAVNGLYQTGFTSFLPTFLGVVYGMTVGQAAVYTSLMVVTGAGAQLVGGWLADRVNWFTMLMLGGVIKASAVASFAIWTPSDALLRVVMVGLGLSIYMTNPAYTALLTNYAGGSSRGRLYGLSFAGSALGSSLGALGIGLLADLLGFRMAFMTVSAFALVRVVLLGALRTRGRRYEETVTQAG